MDDTSQTTRPPLPDDAYEDHNWMVLSLVALGTPLANEAAKAVCDLWGEIERLRASMKELEDAR